MRTDEEVKDCTLLGNQGVKYPTDYAPEVLETFINMGLGIHRK